MRIIFSAATVGACVAAIGVLGLFGAGAASAVPAVDGMIYEDAVAAIEDDGGIPKVSVTVGSRQDAMGACLVTRAVDGSFYRPIPDDVYFGGDEGEVLLTLNCNRGAAKATVPGPSAASPAGRDSQPRPRRPPRRRRARKPNSLKPAKPPTCPARWPSSQ